MGSHQPTDNYNSIQLPPTFLSSERTTNGETRTVPAKPTPPSQTPDYVNTITERVKSDIVKKEAAKPAKPPQQRKKRGQYKKTILRQQAEAAAAAAAAGLPPPVFPPLTSGKGKARASEPSSTATVEGLSVRSQKSIHDKADDQADSEMERELQMLAEEAEEDKRRREEEAADRILKRAQVVKHLRSLKSKLATAQIQIGQDLHYQSVDLFSQLYDEVLEDIGKDNSEMLELLKSTHDDQDVHDSDQEGVDSSSAYPGHMLTRSSDKPRKRDLVSNISKSSVHAGQGHPSDEHIRMSQTTQIDDDSDDDGDAAFKRYRRSRSSGQYIGQSWNVGSGLDESSSHSIAGPSTSDRKSQSSLGKPLTLGLESEDDDTPSPRRSQQKAGSLIRTNAESREELQLRHRKELEELQLQQRNDQEEFQRRQLDQLRELQERQSKEFQEFEDVKAQLYQQHLDGQAEKRRKLSQTQHSRSSDSTSSRYRRTESFSLDTLSYEVGSSYRAQSPDHSPSHISSPLPQRVSKKSHAHQGTSAIQTSTRDQTLSIKSSSSSSYTQHRSHARTHGFSGGVDPLPMSTMTLALTAMNEKKKQMRRAMKKQTELEDTSDDSSDQDKRHGRSRLLSPPIWSQKRGAVEEHSEVKRRPSIANSQLVARSSNSTTSNQLQKTASNTTLSQSHLKPAAGSLTHPAGAAAAAAEESRMSKTKSRKRKNHMSTEENAHETTSESATKSAIGFNKTLLSHFEKWNQDEKTENFCDFVLSDPPDIDVDDSEFEGLLKRDGHGSSGGHQQEPHGTPTSNAFRWYQEQQKLAQELAQQPRIAPLRLGNADDDDNEAADNEFTVGPSDLDSHSHGLGSGEDHGLVLGEDPLAMYMQPRKKSHDARGPSSTASTLATPASLATARAQNRSTLEGMTNNHNSAVPDSSPFLTSSPGATMLYSEDGAEDWDFSAFPLDATDDYLHHDQDPLAHF
ncbi:hypothetical protein BGZ75_005984 [Mortierella antarctica]|nr:hypothetical protein BGZ75_005984 [Mortierella antarctica]